MTKNRKGKKGGIDLNYAKFKKILLVGLWIIFLSVNQVETISFDQLIYLDNQADSQGQLIQIRGFLYQAPSGQFILSSHPHLKSCCIGTQSTLRKQIIVKDYITDQPTQQAILLRGWLKIDPLFNQQGELLQWYILERTEQILPSSFPFLLLFLATGGVLMSLIFFLRRTFKSDLHVDIKTLETETHLKNF